MSRWRRHDVVIIAIERRWSSIVIAQPRRPKIKQRRRQERSILQSYVNLRHAGTSATAQCVIATLQITATTCFNQISETSQTFLNRGSSRRPLIAHKISPDCHIDDRSYLQPTGRWIFLSLSAGRRRSRRSVVGSGAVIHIKLDSAAFSIWKYRISHEYCCFNQAVSSTKEIECRRLIAQCMHNVWKHRKGWVDWYVTTQCYSSLSSLC